MKNKIIILLIGMLLLVVSVACATLWAWSIKIGKEFWWSEVTAFYGLFGAFTFGIAAMGCLGVAIMTTLLETQNE